MVFENWGDGVGERPFLEGYGLVLDGGETAVSRKKERPGVGNLFFDSLGGEWKAYYRL
jgi:hypothetical protein